MLTLVAVGELLLQLGGLLLEAVELLLLLVEFLLLALNKPSCSLRLKFVTGNLSKSSSDSTAIRGDSTTSRVNCLLLDTRDFAMVIQGKH